MPSKRDEPSRFLIAAGCAQYDDPNLPELPQVVADIASVRRLFGGLEYSDALAELENKTTANRLRDELSGWFSDAARQDGDVVVFYFAGHGYFSPGREHYLCTKDFDSKQPQTKGVAAAALPRLIFEGHGRKRPAVWILLDTCYAGLGALDVARSLADYLGRSVAQDACCWVLAAARPKDEAKEGAFVAALVETVEEVLQNPAFGGASQLTIPLDYVAQGINQRLTDRGLQQQAMPATIGIGADFLRNPRHRAGLAGHDLESQQLLGHWILKAKGAGLEEPGWFFTGRAKALRRVAGWMRDKSLDGGMYLVTGDPGSGKSALLGRIVTLSQPQIRAQLAKDGLLKGISAATMPAVNSVDVALHARGMHAQEVRSALGSAAGVPDASLEATLQSLAQRKRPLRVVIDAVDEAQNPQEFVQDGLLPFAHAKGVRLVVGTRRHLLPALGQLQDEVDLDGQYRDPQAVANYVERYLRESQPGGLPSQFQNRPDAAQAVASAVQAAAGGSFLIARLAARRIAQEDVPDLKQAGWEAALGVPADWRDAHEQELARFGDFRQRVEDVLRPLAFARGRGLPWERIWPALATALSGRECSDADILAVQERAGYLIVEDVADGVSVYRLLHETLGEYLRPQRPLQPELDPHERTVARALLGLIPPRAAGPDWVAETRPYLRKHLGEHAQAGRLLGELMQHPGFLLMADADSLLATLRSAPDQVDPDVSSLYRRTIHLLRDRPPAEAASYLEMAARQVARLADWAQPLRQEGFATRWHTLWSDWTPISPHRVIQTSSERIYQIQGAILQDRAVVLTGGLEGGLLVHDLETARQLPLALAGGRILSLSVVQDDAGPFVAALTHDWSPKSKSTVEVWNLQTRQQVCRSVRTPGTRLLLVRHDQDLLLLTWGNPSRPSHERKLQMWRIGGQKISPVPCRKMTPIAGGQLASGGWIATAAGDVVHVYSIPKFRKLFDVPIDAGLQPRSMLVQQRENGFWVALAGENGQVRFGQAGGPLRAEKMELDMPALEAGTIGGQTHLFLGGSDNIRIHVEGQPAPTTLRGQRSWTESLTLVAHRGQHQLVSADDANLRVWDQQDWATADRADTQALPTAMISDPQSAGSLLIASPGEIRLQRAVSGDLEQRFRLKSSASVECLASARIRGTNYLAAGFRGGFEVVDRDSQKTILSFDGRGADRTMAVGLIEHSGAVCVAAVRFPDTIELFDLSKKRGQPRQRTIPRQLVYAATFTQLGDDWVLLAGGDGGWIQALDPLTAKPQSRQLRCGSSVDAIGVTRWDNAPIAVVAASADSLTDIAVCAWNLDTGKSAADNIRWAGSAGAIAGGMLHGQPAIVLGTAEGIVLFRADGTLLGEIRLDAAVIDLVLEEAGRILVATTKGLLALAWLG